MWRRVEVWNYRSIEHARVDLAPFSVLVGPNGSGKSNFADVPVFVRDVGVDASSAVQRRGGIAAVRRATPGEPAEIRIEVRAAASRGALDTDFDAHSMSLQSGVQGAWRFVHERVEVVEGGEAKLALNRTDGELQLLPPLDQTPYRPLRVGATASAMVLARQLVFVQRPTALGSVHRIRLNTDAMRSPQIVAEAVRLDESGSNIATALQSMTPTARENVVRAMAKIIPGLVALSTEILDRFAILRFVQVQGGGSTAAFSATEMSEGALRALGILIAAEQMEPDELLIIEEPEVSIHASAAEMLVEVLKRASERGAVLLTTHSADLLDAARDEEILVCDYQEGTTRIGPLASAQREIVEEGLFSVAELLRSERLRIEGAPAHLIDPRDVDP
jgi:type I restriction enzyme M protein